MGTAGRNGGVRGGGRVKGLRGVYVTNYPPVLYFLPVMDVSFMSPTQQCIQ